MCVDCNNEFVLPTGGDGTPGTVGPTGPRGARVRTAAGNPVVTVGDLSGDTYMDTTTGELWTYNGTIWVDNAHSLIGPIGPTGLNGWSIIPQMVTSVDGYGNPIIVIRVLDYTGGTGSKPAGIGYYIGYSGLVPLIANATNISGAAGTVGVTGPGYLATSATNINISTTTIPSSVTLTTQAGLAYSVGARARASANTTNYLEGVVTAYSGTTMTILVDRKVGAGSYGAWNINLAGDIGAPATLVASQSGMFRVGRSTDYTCNNPLDGNLREVVVFDDDNTGNYFNQGGVMDGVSYKVPAGGVTNMNFRLENFKFIFDSAANTGVYPTPVGGGSINQTGGVAVQITQLPPVGAEVVLVSTQPIMNNFLNQNYIINDGTGTSPKTLVMLETGNISLPAGTTLGVRLLFAPVGGYANPALGFTVKSGSRFYNVQN
jgi:hypothetical protein